MRAVPEQRSCLALPHMQVLITASQPHRSTTKAGAPQRPQGWFLSRVVAPLYRVMRTEMNRKTSQGKPLGHTNKCNYDDFNEFFWSDECLRYSYYLGDEENTADSSLNRQDSIVKKLGDRVSSVLTEAGFGNGSQSGPPISRMSYRKTYIERRSWLHPIRQFWRVHAFLLCMLHVLFAFAFCDTRTGIIPDAELLQAVSGVVVTHAALGVVRELLGIFTMHGMLHTHPASLISLVLRLVLKVLATAVLGVSYATLVSEHPFESLRGMPATKWVMDALLPNEVFSCAALVYAVPHLLSLLAQLFPALSSFVRRLTGPLKVAVDIFEPLNRLFVGKDIHVELASKLPYDFFWLSLLTLKFTYSYTVQIQPLVAPTREIWHLDLSSWGPIPGLDLGKFANVVVILVRWLPILLMYMIDTQLWFMLWVAAYGTWHGSKLHIGEVTDLDGVRDVFMLAAENFNRKVVSAAVGMDAVVEKPFRVPRFATKAAGKKDTSPRATTLEGLPGSDLHEAFLLSGDDGGSGEIYNESLRYFADAWNAALYDMRQGDLLSNNELAVLVFNCWTSSGHMHFTRCTYLPVFCTAGKLAEAFEVVRALSEKGEHADLRRRQALELKLFTELGNKFEVREALGEFVELSQWLLAGLLGSRHASAVTTLQTALWRCVARGEVLDVLVATHLPKLASSLVDLAKLTLALKLAEPGSGAPNLDEKSSVGKLVDKLRSTLDALKAVIGRAPKAIVQELEGIKFTGTGLFWDDSYARATIAQLRAEEQATEKLQGLVRLCTTAQIDTTPQEPEVKRRLCWFIGSLFMEMPRSPPVKQMHSWTVMTPFYAEDLLYSAKELASKTEDGVSMLIFLKTVREDEWR